VDVISTPSTSPSPDTGSEPVFEARRDRLWITFAVVATFLLILGGIALFWLRDGNGTQAAYTLGLVLFLIVFNVWYYQRAAVWVRLAADEIEARTLFGKTFSVPYEDVAKVVEKPMLRLVGWDRRPVLHLTRGFKSYDELPGLIRAKLDVDLADV
jgi:hypothetical protein